MGGRLSYVGFELWDIITEGYHVAALMLGGVKIGRQGNLLVEEQLYEPVRLARI